MGIRDSLKSPRRMAAVTYRFGPFVLNRTEYRLDRDDHPVDALRAHAGRQHLSPSHDPMLLCCHLDPGRWSDFATHSGVNSLHPARIARDA